MSWFLSRSIFDKVKSTVLEFLNFSISRRNFASFTGKPPSSEIMDPGSSPTSSTNNRPNKSSVKRQRPKKMLLICKKFLLAVVIIIFCIFVIFVSKSPSHRCGKREAKQVIHQEGCHGGRLSRSLWDVDPVGFSLELERMFRRSHWPRLREFRRCPRAWCRVRPVARSLCGESL